MSNNNITIIMPNPLGNEEKFQIQITDYNNQHTYYSSMTETMGNFSVNFTLLHVNRVIVLDNDIRMVEIANSSFSVIGQSPTIVFDPHNETTLYNIDFCLKNCLHLHTNLRQEVMRLLQAYVKNNPRPVSLAVSINQIHEFVSRLYDYDEDQEDGDQLSKRKRTLLNSDIGNLRRMKVKDALEEYCCSICLENNTTQQEGVTLTFMPCNHGFHDHCILKWLKACPSCPVCRFELGPSNSGMRSE